MSDRRWLELGVRSPSEGDQKGLLAEGLLSLGGRAVQEQDGWLLTHLEEPADVEAFTRRARSILQEAVGSQEVELQVRWRDHVDWSEAWKKGLEPRRLTDRLVVTPSWHEVDARSEDIVIVLDPGMAFGTAEHGTTRGCLRLLDRAVVGGEHVLDVGAGSGILSIAAAALGASEVRALEGDALALEALEENVERNGTLDQVQWIEAWADSALIESLSPVDGIVANIESGILRPLLPGFAATLVEGGWLILSGILAEEWSLMEQHTVAHGFRTLVVDEDGEWRSGWFVRTP
jgi:ribosomal protein L11 methyltransferase